MDKERKMRSIMTDRERRPAIHTQAYYGYLGSDHQRMQIETGCQKP